MNDLPGWDELENRTPTPRTPPVTLDGEDFSKLTLRLFGSRDGAVWFNHMTALKFNVMIAADISNERLRFLEGQRQLLREIQALMDSARALAAKERKIDVPSP